MYVEQALDGDSYFLLNTVTGYKIQPLFSAGNYFTPNCINYFLALFATAACYMEVTIIPNTEIARSTSFDMGEAMTVVHNKILLL